MVSSARRSIAGVIKPALAIGLLGLCAAANATSIGVPSYWYPGSTWTTTGQSAPTVGLTIINPNSGPVVGATDTAAYQAQVATTHAQGVLVLGYVHTSNGTRSWLASGSDPGVKSEIDLYFNTFHTDGIFLDEGPGTGTAGTYLSYYTTIHDYIKTKWAATDSKGVIVLNPGTSTDQAYMATADIVCIFEDTYTNYMSYTPPSWVTQYDPSRFWHMIHSLDAGNISEVQQVMAHAKLPAVNGGWVYVTDLPLSPNPYSTLPSTAVWNEEVESAQAMDRWRASNDNTNLYLTTNYNHTWDYYRVYLDTDKNAATGYPTNGIGANYLIENGSLYSYSGTGGSWSWTFAGAVTTATTTGTATGSTKYTVPLSMIGSTTLPKSESVIFEVQRYSSGVALDNKTVDSAKYTHSIVTMDANIQQYRAENDTDRVYYSATFAGTYPYKHVFIDTDAVASTGYAVGGIGADYMVENGTLYKYSGTSGAWGWTSIGSSGMTNSGTAYTWSIFRSSLGLTNFNLNTSTMLWQFPKVVFQGTGGTTTVTEPAITHVLSD